MTAHELRSTEITAHDGRSRSTVDLVDLLLVVDLAGLDLQSGLLKVMQSTLVS